MKTSDVLQFLWYKLTISPYLKIISLCLLYYILFMASFRSFTFYPLGTGFPWQLTVSQQYRNILQGIVLYCLKFQGRKYFVMNCIKRYCIAILFTQAAKMVFYKMIYSGNSPRYLTVLFLLMSCSYLLHLSLYQFYSNILFSPI